MLKLILRKIRTFSRIRIALFGCHGRSTAKKIAQISQWSHDNGVGV